MEKVKVLPTSFVYFDRLPVDIRLHIIVWLIKITALDEASGHKSGEKVCSESEYIGWLPPWSGPTMIRAVKNLLYINKEYAGWFLDEHKSALLVETVEKERIPPGKKSYKRDKFEIDPPKRPLIDMFLWDCQWLLWLTFYGWHTQGAYAWAKKFFEEHPKQKSLVQEAIERGEYRIAPEPFVAKLRDIGFAIPDYSLDGSTSLIRAARVSKYLDAEMIIKARCCDINKQDNSGNTALLAALQSMSLAFIELLLIRYHNMDLTLRNNQGQDALTLLRALVEDLHIPYSSSENGLSKALSEGHYDIAILGRSAA